MPQLEAVQLPSGTVSVVGSGSDAFDTTDRQKSSKINFHQVNMCVTLCDSFVTS